MEALAKYQHENGGFGGLDYEFEYQGPCLKCTEHAIEYILNLKDYEQRCIMFNLSGITA